MQAAHVFANQSGSVMDKVCSILRGVKKTSRQELTKTPQFPFASNFVHIGKKQ
jgi:hypothetical protein